MRKLTTASLELATWIAKLGSFTAAAERLYTTQPAVSLEIALQLGPDAVAILAEPPEGLFSGAVSSTAGWLTTFEVDVVVPLDGSVTPVEEVVQWPAVGTVTVDGFLDVDGDGEVTEGDLVAEPGHADEIPLPASGAVSVIVVLAPF